jgi:hypothetical protein
MVSGAKVTLWILMLSRSRARASAQNPLVSEVTETHAEPKP